MRLTLALLEPPAAPAMPDVPLDLEARAKAIEILVRIIAQTLATSTEKNSNAIVPYTLPTA